MNLFQKIFKLKTSLYLFKVWILKGKFTDDYFIFFFINNRDGAVIIFFKNVPVKKEERIENKVLKMYHWSDIGQYSFFIKQLPKKYFH